MSSSKLPRKSQRSSVWPSSKAKLRLKKIMAWAGGISVFAGAFSFDGDKWISQIWSFGQRAIAQSPEEICTQPLTEQSETDIELLRQQFNACTQLIQGENASAEIYMSRGRVSILLFDLNKSFSGSNIDQALEDLKSASGFVNQNPRAFFYKGYAQDFQEIVLPLLKNPSLSKEDLVCPLVHDSYKGEKNQEDGRYSDAIEQYLAKHQAVLQRYKKHNTDIDKHEAVAQQDDLAEEDAYILIELGHWATNRDRNVAVALDLYRIVLAYYGSSTDSPITHNALASIGVAYASLGEPKVASNYFEKALAVEESPELYSNLGSVQIRSGQSYNQAAQSFEKAAVAEESHAKDNSEDYSPSKIYKFRRSQAYALLLSGILEYEAAGFFDQATEKYDKAYSILKELESNASSYEALDGDYLSDDSLFLTALGIATYHKAFSSDEVSLKSENLTENELVRDARASFIKALNLNENLTLASEYLAMTDRKEITRLENSTYMLLGFFGNPIPHDVGHDVVLEVEHKKFYCYDENTQARDWV